MTENMDLKLNLLEFGSQLTGNPKKAKEIVDSLLERSKDMVFGSEASKKAFLYTTMRNDCYDYLRLMASE